MEVTGGEEEGYVREWAPCTHMLSLIPPRVQSGLFSHELSITCLDAVSEYVALGTNVGLVYWYDRKKGTVQRLRCEASNSAITYVKIVNTVDYMVGAGSAAGQVTVFQIPKEHPDNIPENLKPKVEPKVERYTIGDLHKSPITAIEWSKNGMKLFSGDKNGIIIMSEIDFYMHLCKSMEIVNEQHEIVQLSYQKGALLVSSVYRSIVCERREHAWQCTQLGKKERHFLCKLGGVLVPSWSGAARHAYCARAGLRLWRADAQGQVLQTLLFKDAISNPLTIVELLNPAQKRHSHAEKDYNFGPIHVLKEQFLVTYNDDILYILDPRSLTAVAVVDNLRRILSVSVNKDEIFILEGPRSVIRLAHTPETGIFTTDEPVNLMTKSLTSSFHQAVNTVRDFTHIDQTVPFITSVLEQPISMLTKNEFLDSGGNISKAEECFELPPIKQLPSDVSENVLQSIINEFKDVTSETEELRRVKSEELQKKLKIFNSIMERKYEGELIHSSRRSKRKEPGSAHSTPRNLTPARVPVPGDVAYTSPCVMDCSYIGNESETDELLEKQIEEKEKILAKMLNLESLSIKSKPLQTIDRTDGATLVPSLFYDEEPDKPVEETKKPIERNGKPVQETGKPDQKIKSENKKPVNKPDPNLVPKMVKLPNNWMLEDLKLDLSSKRHYGSPDNNSDGEWEMV